MSLDDGLLRTIAWFRDVLFAGMDADLTGPEETPPLDGRLGRRLDVRKVASDG